MLRQRPALTSSQFDTHLPRLEKNRSKTDYPDVLETAWMFFQRQDNSTFGRLFQYACGTAAMFPYAYFTMAMDCTLSAKICYVGK